MKLDPIQKTLFLTDLENGLEPILQEVTNIRPENMLTIQSFGSVISHPNGDIMRSVLIAIYQENVEEIFVVGSKEKRTPRVDIRTQLESIKDNIQTLDYLFQNSRPELAGGTLHEWLNGEENISDNIEKSVNIIRNHPLVPSYVKVRGLMINNRDESVSFVEVPTDKAVSIHS